MKGWYKTMNKITYYARNKKEKDLDDQIRNALLNFGDKAQMAIYLQNQMILNELRRISTISDKMNY